MFNGIEKFWVKHMETQFVEQARIYKEKASNYEKVQKKIVPRLSALTTKLKNLSLEIEELQNSINEKQPENLSSNINFDELIPSVENALDRGEEITRDYLQTKHKLSKMQAYYLLNRVRKEVPEIKEKKEGRTVVLYK